MGLDAHLGREGRGGNHGDSCCVESLRGADTGGERVGVETMVTAVVLSHCGELTLGERGSGWKPW